MPVIATAQSVNIKKWDCYGAVKADEGGNHNQKGGALVHMGAW